MLEPIEQTFQTDEDPIDVIVDQISILGGMSDSQVYDVVQRLKKVSYQRGELVFRQGDPASSIYIVLTGFVQLLFAEGRHPMSNRQFGVGECFGETSVIGILPHSASMIAVDNVDLLELSKDDLGQIFEEDTELFSRLVLNIARETCRRLHQTNELLEKCFQSGELVTPHFIPVQTPSNHGLRR
ncbi:cyclic nucleotide-binding domain-containing protein [Aurantivibrio infirmus]